MREQPEGLGILLAFVPSFVNRRVARVGLFALAAAAAHAAALYDDSLLLGTLGAAASTALALPLQALTARLQALALALSAATEWLTRTAAYPA
jgi:hypothetical protein